MATSSVERFITQSDLTPLLLAYISAGRYTISLYVCQAGWLLVLILALLSARSYLTTLRQRKPYQALHPAGCTVELVQQPAFA